MHRSSNITVAQADNCDCHIFFFIRYLVVSDDYYLVHSIHTLSKIIVMVLTSVLITCMIVVITVYFVKPSIMTACTMANGFA